MNRVKSRLNQTGAMGLIVTMFLAVLLLVPVSMKMMRVSHKTSSQQVTGSVQADNVARAGLTEAILWFRRQDSQPVRSNSDPVAYPWTDAAFYPRESTNTLTNATLDESIGLVKEFSLSESGKIWGRFEVKRQPNTDSKPFDPEAVHDISDKRIEGATAGEGLAWSLQSRGYVYIRRDSSVSFDQSPNEIVGRSRASTEIRRLGLTLPVNAAVLVNNRSQTTIQSNGRIVGGSDTGLGYYQGTSGPSKSGSGSELSGSPDKQDIDGIGTNGSLTPTTILGVSESELKLMSDINVDSPSGIGAEYPSMAIVFINGNATFSSAHKLRGGGILYVKGDLVLESTSNSLFSGFIYVTGNATLSGPALIAGCMAVQGTLLMKGAGDVSQVEYDGVILNSVRQQIAQYRENKSMFYVFSDGK